MREENKLKIREVTRKLEWNNFVYETAPNAFFQSWEWGEVEKMSGHKVKRFGLYEDDQLVGGAQTTEMHAQRGDYLYIRHGPVLKEWKNVEVGILTNFLKEHADLNKLSFVRISPLIKTQQAEPLQDIDLVEAPIHNMDAQVNYVISLEHGLNEILMEMRKNTRRIVQKVSQDNNLVLKIGAEKVLVDDFLSLYKYTAAHKHFVEWEGIHHEVKKFSASSRADAECILITIGVHTVAGAIITYWGNQGIYHYAAATREGLQQGAAYRIVWEAIKRTKQHGLPFFNLWGGISDIDDKTHPWYGLTVFKRGFGAKKREHIPALDLPRSLSYWKTYMIETAIKYIRGYEKVGRFRSPPFLRSVFGV